MLNLADKLKASPDIQESALSTIEHLNGKLYRQFKSKFVPYPALSRSLVSFQANKNRAVYRWYKYKEAFSASLIEYLLKKYRITSGRILDPFAGSGTALFSTAATGVDADGIELLPIGQQIILTRKLLESEWSESDLAVLRRWFAERTWRRAEAKCPLPELRITKGAYPKRTKESIEKYLAAAQAESEHLRIVLRFILLCVLESVSYTRKDGQYLRWDYRSGRRQGKKVFDKGKILDFEQAVCAKADEILCDLSETRGQTGLSAAETSPGEILLHKGSCLELMPHMPGTAYDAVVTSPPYCNRYDYTRTYALELALLGADEAEIIRLRQQMLSCTVENRAKDLLNLNPRWREAVAAADEQELLQEILKYLDEEKAEGRLNNAGIPRMVRGYFYEMACIIAECFRVLKPHSYLLMVNDNVRYAGASISVDLILSDIAEKLGFNIDSILVLPSDKGNSSQQMGAHGREPLRKCVYVWRKL